ncbi:MAG: DUF4190 domain-containing protein [Defluviitaleaceae bacterium]|nr:DUF4190 domain-containing protein [Defluviitaleaceae bacterium]
MNHNPHGAPPPPPYGGPPMQPPGHSKAVASLVTGILSLIIPFIGVILGIVAVVLATGAQKEGFRGGMATGGLVMGIIAVALWAFSLVSCLACACTMPWLGW